MNWKRAQAWLRGDHSICVVCSRDFDHCKHSHLDIDKKIEELKIDERIKRVFRQKLPKSQRPS